MSPLKRVFQRGFFVPFRSDFCDDICAVLERHCYQSLPIEQVADLLGHTTTEITDLYYVKKDNTKLEGLTDAFNL